MFSLLLFKSAGFASPCTSRRLGSIRWCEVTL